MNLIHKKDLEDSLSTKQRCLIAVGLPLADRACFSDPKLKYSAVVCHVQYTFVVIKVYKILIDGLFCSAPINDKCRNSCTALWQETVAGTPNETEPPLLL